MKSEFEAYVLCESRDAALVKRLIQTISTTFEPLAADYPFPALSDSPTVVYRNAQHLATRLLGEENEPYSLYWRNTLLSNPHQFMIFFTSDAAIIVGIASQGDNQSEQLKQLALTVGGRVNFGMITADFSPPGLAKDFIRLCCEAETTRIVNGNLMAGLIV